MTHVIGPQQIGLKLSTSNGWDMHEKLGLPAGEPVKFIGTQGAPAAAILGDNQRPHVINFTVSNLESTNRRHLPGSDLALWPGDPTSEADLADGRWGIHVHGVLPDPNTGQMPTVSDCRFRWVNNEHGIYACGSIRSERNHFDHCAAQGLQLWFTAAGFPGGAKPGTLGTVPADWPEYTGGHLEIGSYGDHYDHCGLFHGRGRAAYACSIKAGPEHAVVADCTFDHNHHPGDWLEWATNAEPGAILIEHRPSCDIRRNAFNYDGMQSSTRGMLYIKDIAGLARLRKNNVFAFGGKIAFVDCGDVLLEGCQWKGVGPPPRVSVIDNGVTIWKGLVTDTWST